MNNLSPETYAALQQKLAAMRVPATPAAPQAMQPAPSANSAPAAAALPSWANTGGAAPVVTGPAHVTVAKAAPSTNQQNAIAGQQSGQAANNAAATADELGASTDPQGSLPAPTSLDQFSKYCASGAPLGGPS